VKFSRDFKVLLARIDRNNVVAYDLNTGLILKKWHNFDENWIDVAMTSFGGDKIATKSNLLLLKVWNFVSGREEAAFYGYDSYSLCFSANGLYLACGAKYGSEVARIWGINEKKYAVFHNIGSNNNFHTVVHLTSPEPKRLICCATDQQPLVFNSHTRELLFKCECQYRLEEIYEIQSDLRYNVFIIKGRDDKKRNIGLMYKISDGTLLEVYENYTVLELAKNTGVLVSKCDNINGGKLTSTDIKNLNDPILNDFQIQEGNCQILNDNKSAVITKGDEFSSEYNFINVENGSFIGKIDFIKKIDRKSLNYITVDIFTEDIYFRYFEFLSPQETMVFKKKNLINVDEETTE
jgi:WD40 repeat protein